MRQTTSLALAGFVTTAIAFGPARIGFGLFLPKFRQIFELSSTQAGFIASAAFLFFLIALPMAIWLDTKKGPRIPLLVGALLAALGLLIVASATKVITLTVGIAVAGAGAGLCWSPFNDATEKVAPYEQQSKTLSAVSTGTAIGIVLAGLSLLSTDLSGVNWRLPWIIFGGIGLFAIVLISFAVPYGNFVQDAKPSEEKITFLGRPILPLYIAALAFGLSNAVYISFAADHIVSVSGFDGMDAKIGAIIFISYGLCGIIGVFAGAMSEKMGLYRLIAFIFWAFAISLLLIAMVPGSWMSIIVSAGLHGGAVMLISAVLSFWSLSLFPGKGATGFTIALIVVAISCMAGSAIAGMAADVMGLSKVFLVTAVVPTLTAIFFQYRGRSALRTY